MAEKKINARIIHKHDTEENWLKSSFIPKQGEIIVYDIDSSHSYERIKIGDGTTNVNDLPFSIEEYVANYPITETNYTTMTCDGSGKYGLPYVKIISAGASDDNSYGMVVLNDSSASLRYKDNRFIINPSGASFSSTTKLSNIQTPTSDNDAANKAYVDSALIAITNDEIDTICGATIQAAEDVTL